MAQLGSVENEENDEATMYLMVVHVYDSGWCETAATSVRQRLLDKGSFIQASTG